MKLENNNVNKIVCIHVLRSQVPSSGMPAKLPTSSLKGDCVLLFSSSFSWPCCMLVLVLQAEVTGVLRPSIALDSTTTTDESSDSLINHKQS